MVKERLEETDSRLANKLSEDELITIFFTMFRLIGELIQKETRVIFEGYLAFFTNPVKRKCTNLHTNEVWWTYKHRIRMKPLDELKRLAETEISEEEYNRLTKK